MQNELIVGRSPSFAMLFAFSSATTPLDMAMQEITREIDVGGTSTPAELLHGESGVPDLRHVPVISPHRVVRLEC